MQSWTVLYDGLVGEVVGARGDNLISEVGIAHADIFLSSGVQGGSSLLRSKSLID